MKLGRYISRGKNRKVYHHPTDPDKVIKYNNGRGAPANNFREWAAWQVLKNTTWRDTLAPCYELSECGYYLVQHKCEPYTTKTETPEGIIDRGKKKNWGTINGRPVLLDYDNCRPLLQKHGKFTRELKKTMDL